MARRGDQELNDQLSSTAFNYKGNAMDQLQQHWTLIVLVIVLLLVLWKYGLSKK